MLLHSPEPPPVVDEVGYVALTRGVNATHQAAALRRQLEAHSLQQRQQHTHPCCAHQQLQMALAACATCAVRAWQHDNCIMAPHPMLSCCRHASAAQSGTGTGLCLRPQGAYDSSHTSVKGAHASRLGLPLIPEAGKARQYQQASGCAHQQSMSPVGALVILGQPPACLCCCYVLTNILAHKGALGDVLGSMHTPALHTQDMASNPTHDVRMLV